MNLSDKNLDQLFNQAREQKPVATLDETKRAFLTATVAAAGGVLATNGLLKLLTVKKWIIMFSTISIITTGALILALSPSPKEEQINNAPIAESTVQTEENHISEIKEDTFIATNHNIVLDTPENSLELNEGVVIDDMNISEETDFTSIEEDGIAFAQATVGNDGLSQSQARIKPYDQRFDITVNTTEEDLENIKAIAKDAGIELRYKAKFNESKLTKLRLKIDFKVDGDNAEYYMSSTDLKEDFSFTLVWDEAENGQAEEFNCGNTEQLVELENTEELLLKAETELADLFAELNLDELLIEMDSLTAEISVGLEQEWNDLESELIQYEIELKELTQEDFDAILLEISESSAELLRVLQEELHQMQLEVEKLHEAESEEEEEGEEEDAPAPQDD